MVVVVVGGRVKDATRVRCEKGCCFERRKEASGRVVVSEDWMVRCKEVFCPLTVSCDALLDAHVALDPLDELHLIGEVDDTVHHWAEVL